MNILIIEDEPLAAAQLVAHISALRAKAKILAVCDTVKSAVEWIKNHENPDLAFFDIQLGDGLSFNIFEQVEFKNPVIFTTAFDQYAIQAFKVNSIDYLLKPIERDELEKAIIKFESFSLPVTSKITPQILNEIISNFKNKGFKERFLVKIGTHLRIVDVKDILYFYSFQKGTFIKSVDRKDFLIDQSLELIEELVDPSKFFRINRKYLISLPAIKDVITYSNSRLKLKVEKANGDDFLVAREKVKAFKKWVEG